MTSTALTPIQQAKSNLAKMEEQFKSLLPSHVPTRGFIRLAIMAAESEPKLLQHPRSFYSAVKLAAQDGLNLDGRDAALIPYKGKAKYSPMVGGIIKRARNSGEISSVTPAIVYKNDEFEIDYAKAEPITFKPSLSDRGEAIGAICIVWYKHGGMEFEWMTKSEIMEVKGCSQQQKSLQWTTFWTEGWKKSVVRRLFKRIPMSSELDRVITSDDDFYDMTPRTVQDDRPTGAALLEQVSTQEGEFEEVTGEEVSGEEVSGEEAEPEDAV